MPSTALGAGVYSSAQTVCILCGYHSGGKMSVAEESAYSVSA